MTDHVTLIGRTRSTSISQREVIQAQGHTGSNHISTGVGVAEMSAESVTMPTNLRYSGKVLIPVKGWPDFNDSLTTSRT